MKITENQIKNVSSTSNSKLFRVKSLNNLTNRVASIKKLGLAIAYFMR